MEGNPHLLQLIRKMRSQINKLERENRALKGELRAHSAAGTGRGQRPCCGGTGGVRGIPGIPARRRRGRPSAQGAHRCGVSSPCLSPLCSRQKRAHTHNHAITHPALVKDTTMTVRRYPSASPAPSSTRCHWAGRKPPSLGLLEMPGSAQPPAPPAAAQLSREQEEGLGKSPTSCVSCSHPSNVQLFQERVCKCQGKVKAVSFLLPTDMSSFAEKQGSLKSPQNQSTKHLMTITEKDM